MKDKKMIQMVGVVAELAIRAGMEFSLCLHDSEISGDVFRGAFSTSSARDNGIELRCWWPQPADEDRAGDELEEAEDEEVADCDDA